MKLKRPSVNWSHNRSHQ